VIPSLLRVSSAGALLAILAKSAESEVRNKAIVYYVNVVKNSNLAFPRRAGPLLPNLAESYLRN